MKMRKIREFAEECNCTQQNIYQHLKTYETELDGHVHQGKRGKLLDEQACDFLRSVMNPKEISADDEMQETIARLRAMLVEVNMKNSQLSQEVSDLKGRNKELELDLENRNQLLLVSQEQEHQKAAELEAVSKARDELQEEHNGLKDRYDELQISNNNLVENYKDLTERFQEEKNRKLTLKERFTGRKSNK